jgi:predicted nucleotidyltransferase
MKDQSATVSLDQNDRQAIQILTERLAQTLSDQILSTTLFGSKARGDAGADSDIDILVIIRSEDWQTVRKIRQIGARVSLEQDVLFNMHIVDRAQWAEMERAQSTYWRNVQRDGIKLLPQAA